MTGHQWWWEVQYRDSLPQDWVTTANEIHIPVGRPVAFELRSTDVIHSFWPPNLSPKRDQIPGDENSLWFLADRAGEYRGMCAEFCGHQHAKMAFLIVAEPPGQFATWLAGQRDTALTPTDPLARRGRDVFLGLYLRHVPRHRGHAGWQPDRSRSHSPGKQADDRRGHPPEQPSQPDRLDRRSSGDQARSQDATEPAQRPRSGRPGSVSGDPQVTRAPPAEAGRPADEDAVRRQLEQTWRQPPGLMGLAPQRGPQVHLQTVHRDGDGVLRAGRNRGRGHAGPAGPAGELACWAPTRTISSSPCTA